MATTLSYGFVKPVTGDKGSVFFPVLENNIQQLNDHTHNGTNSAKITSAASVAVTQALSAASWVAGSDGVYTMAVTMPAGLTGNGGVYNGFGIEFRNTANGRKLYLQTQSTSTTTYTLICNDNSLDVTVIYS